MAWTKQASRIAGHLTVFWVRRRASPHVTLGATSHPAAATAVIYTLSRLKVECLPLCPGSKSPASGMSDKQHFAQSIPELAPSQADLNPSSRLASNH